MQNTIHAAMCGWCLSAVVAIETAVLSSVESAPLPAASSPPPGMLNSMSVKREVQHAPLISSPKRDTSPDTTLLIGLKLSQLRALVFWIYLMPR
eukprot:6487591-Amphidinium_carterae.3